MKREFLAFGIIVIVLFILTNLFIAYRLFVVLPDSLVSSSGQIELAKVQIQGFAYFFGIIALVFTGWRAISADRISKANLQASIAANKNAEAALKNTEINLKQVKISQESLRAERFTKAIEQLSSDNLSLRVGGIYGLEKISHESKKESQIIIQILSTFLREKTSIKKNKSLLEESIKENKIPLDIQAIINVFSERKVKNGKGYIELNSLNLSGAEFGGDFRIRFEDSILNESRFSYTNLSNANFSNSSLKKAVFREEIDLSGAYFKNADLLGAEFFDANLTNSNFENANLEGVNFAEVNFEGARFIGATFSEETFVDFEALSKAETLRGSNCPEALREGVEYFNPDIFKNKSFRRPSKRKPQS